MRGTRLKYIGSIVTVIIAVGVAFISPLLLSEIIDSVIGNARPLELPGVLQTWVDARGGREFLANNMWILAAVLIAINIVNGVVMFLRGKWTAQASESIAEKMRNRLYRHLQTLPYDYHVKAATGDLIQRCTSDVETVRRFLSGQLVEIFRAVFMLVIALIIMLRMNVTMTFASLILVPALFAYGMVFFKLTMRRFRETDEAEGRMSAVLQENLTGVRVVRAFGRERFEVEKFNRVNDRYRDLAAHQANLLAYYWSISDLLTMSQSAISLLVGVVMAANGELTVGDLLVFTSYVGQLLWPVRQLGRILSDMGKSFVALDRIDEILCQKSEPNSEAMLHPPINRDIVFDHVTFGYDLSLIHIYLDENLNVADFNRRVAAAYCATVADSIRLARRLNAPVINMHMAKGVFFKLPERRVYLFDEYNARYMDALREFRDECTKLIGADDITICVENTDGYADFQLRALDMLLDSPVFGLTLDICLLYTSNRVLTLLPLTQVRFRTIIASTISYSR